MKERKLTLLTMRLWDFETVRLGDCEMYNQTNR